MRRLHMAAKGYPKRSTGHSECPHGKRWTRCKVCFGGSICKHDRVRVNCVTCKGKAALIRNWKSSAASADKVNGSSGGTDIKTKNMLELIKKHPNCYYCGKKLAVSHDRDRMFSLERINNGKGHISGNLRMSCLKCNTSRVNSRRKKLAGAWKGKGEYGETNKQIGDRMGKPKQ